MEDIAIVTGGNSGLGLEIAKQLVSSNINVCIIGRNEEKTSRAYNELVSMENSSIEKYIGNISDEQFVNNMYDSINEKYNVKYLYNVAGIGMFALPQTVNKQMVEDIFSANLTGLILMSTKALQTMTQKNEGSIINIMSSAAKRGNANESIYCAAKWGARGYTESLITWAKGTNIKVYGVYPGGMNTPFWDNIGIENKNVLNFMNPKEVAQQIVYSVMDKKTIKVTDLTIDRL